jgi:phage portal protein BeeE
MDVKQFSLYGWATAVEEVITSLLATGVFMVISFGGLLRPDTATRYAAYSTAIRDGWLTPNEVRLFENIPPLPEAAVEGEILPGASGGGMADV